MATMINGTTNSLPKFLIEAAQSVVPRKMTDPRLSRRVFITDSNIFQGQFHIIFYFSNVSSEDSGWTWAGWTKESLGMALLEQPILGGRLRRGEEAEGVLEIVSNDSGIRLFEARILKTLAEFLDLEEREEAEAELVYWKDIDEENPEFSPLFYVQVTNFQCGGYSVGISCSLLLADPLAIICFLSRWANIHRKMVSEMTKPPIFYLPKFKPNVSSHTNHVGSNGVKDRRKPLIFIIGKLNPNDVETRKALVLRCIEEAELKLGGKRASKFSLIVKTTSEPEEIEVESYLRQGLVEEKPLGFTSGIICGSWDDLGASEVSFYEGNKPVCVSYWIGSVPWEEGLLVLIPCPDEGVSEEFNVVVTIH